MKWLINYLRQTFCKHDFEYEDHHVTVNDSFLGTKQGIKVYMRCKKCGYHSNHWKHL